MPLPISLQSVVEAMEMSSDEVSSYLNRETGEIVTVTEEDKRLVEDDELDEERLPKWQRDHLPRIREALESEDYLLLPGQREIHEWEIMRRFSEQRTNPREREELLDAIHGSGAFRMFKSTIRRLNIHEEWFRFRQSAIEQIARDWLKEHEIPFR